MMAKLKPRTLDEIAKTSKIAGIVDFDFRSGDVTLEPVSIVSLKDLRSEAIVWMSKENMDELLKEFWYEHSKHRDATIELDVGAEEKDFASFVVRRMLNIEEEKRGGV